MQLHLTDIDLYRTVAIKGSKFRPDFMSKILCQNQNLNAKNVAYIKLIVHLIY